LLIIHSFVTGQGDSLYSGQLLSWKSGSIRMHPFPIQHVCNLRVMTCRKGPNGNETNVAFILLPACWNTIMSSIAPLAPPMAKARKEQLYRKCGEMELSIETDTAFVQDVPMTGCVTFS
jgi:hypothetical protein